MNIHLGPARGPSLFVAMPLLVPRSWDTLVNLWRSAARSARGAAPRRGRARLSVASPSGACAGAFCSSAVNGTDANVAHSGSNGAFFERAVAELKMSSARPRISLRHDVCAAVRPTRGVNRFGISC